MTKKAIELPSSKDVLTFDDDSYDEMVLFKLLDEAHDKKLKNKTKIKTLKEFFPENIEIPKEQEDKLINYAKHKNELMTYSELKKLYEKYTKFHYQGGALYTPNYLTKR